MKYLKSKNFLEILGEEEFDIKQILECGQIFSFNQQENGDFEVFSADKKAVVKKKIGELGYIIESDYTTYFEQFFDLKTDYANIKKKLAKHEIMKLPLKKGGGIRILKQNLFETLISFIVSANNNIKRIKAILWRIRELFGRDMGGWHAFPTRKELLKATEEDFVTLGAGYRAKYLYKVLREVDEQILESWRVLSTEDLQKKLIELSGVGPKVADCIMLFGYGRQDVFPVDTWIAQMYNKYYGDEDNRKTIRKKLIEEFGKLSGYAQQYLFFMMIKN